MSLNLELKTQDKKLDSSKLKNLSLRDQVLFEEYGVGEKVNLPYEKIHHAFEYWAKKQSNALAAEHKGKAITYGVLDKKSFLLSQLLRHHGVKSGDHVGIFLERSIEMVIAIFASLKANATYIPQDARITPRTQLEYIISLSEIKVILTLSHLKAKIPEIDGVKVIAIDEVFINSDFYTESNTTPLTLGSNDNCFVLFTSGTTGAPNGVKVTHKNLINILMTRPGNLGMAPGKKVSQILNISFDMCAWETLGALVNGATLVIRDKSIQKTVEKVDIVIATPSILGSLDAEKCKNVKVVAVAGEPCPRFLADRWSEFCNFHNSCGPTETTIVNTVKAYSPIEKRLTIGSPTPNNTVYILDDNLTPLPIGEIGEMWAGGFCVSNGYLKNELLTDERFKPDPFLGEGHYMFRTRDLGRWTEEGELEHFGRTDDQVKIKGFRIELDSISRALESVESCKQSVTLKINSETLVSFVRPLDVDIERSRKLLKELLPYYCDPKLILSLDSFPKTSRGKIDKRILTQKAVKQLEELE